MSHNQACPVCSNPDNNIFLDKVLGVNVCSACGHTFSYNEQSPDTIYNTHYFSDDHKNWFLHPNLKLFQAIALEIRKVFPSQAVRLLDVGCGNGDLLHFLQRQPVSYQLFGIDLAENSGSGITYIKDEFLNYEFKQNFDVITGLMVIEHIPNPTAFVAKLHDLLSENGITFLVTINNGSIMYRLARIFRLLGWRAPFDRLYHHHHLQHYTNASLRLLMERNGFEVLTQRNHNFPLSAVDLPAGSRFLRGAYFFAVATLFAITNLMGGGMNQTIICKKRV